MKSSATTVMEYLASLPADRRAGIEAIRRVILKNLDKDFEESMLWGMIGYAVPHRVWPLGYHCDPKKPDRAALDAVAQLLAGDVIEDRLGLRLGEPWEYTDLHRDRGADAERRPAPDDERIPLPVRAQVGDDFPDDGCGRVDLENVVDDEPHRRLIRNVATSPQRTERASVRLAWRHAERRQGASAADAA